MRGARRDPEEQAMHGRFEVLAQYNAEVTRGLVHTTEWRELMATYQAEFDQWVTNVEYDEWRRVRR